MNNLLKLIFSFKLYLTILIGNYKCHYYFSDKNYLCALKYEGVDIFQLYRQNMVYN